MFDRIVFISDQSANIKLKDAENVAINLMNLHLVFEDDTKKVLGEVDDLNGDIVKASFLGEIIDGRFVGGTIRKPSLDAKIRIIAPEEIELITGKDEVGYMKLGYTPFYEGRQVYLNVNAFFNSHFAIFGNSGSGKSCGTTRVFQNMFQDQRLFPYKSNIILFDSSGEYYNAFSNLNAINPNYHYRYFSTNEEDPNAEKLRIPIYLLNEDDLALLLQATNHSQLPIIERMLKLALIFSQKDMDAENYKNHLIAKAIMTILYTNETAPNKRNDIFSILASCSTKQFNLEAIVQGIGYKRKFRECFLIDNSGNFTESVLLTEYVSSFIKDDYDNYEPKKGVYYTLDTLEKAMQFTLISEGWLRNKNTYGDAITLKVRLHSLATGPTAKYFEVKNYMSLDTYLTSLLISNNRKYQIVNINLDDIDDDFAKSITKIMSRLIFDFSKNLIDRASIPFHIIYEEAHRYIQNDNDRFLLGYNIFERIAKEGRKYGVILGIITQRPVELSDTVISQCSNFLIFRINHPVDVEYIRKMVPNISDEIVEKQKNLQAGTCLGFGNAFKIPMIVKMEMPNPAPWSGSCDVVKFWNGGASGVAGFTNTTQTTSAAPAASAPSNDGMNISMGAAPTANVTPAVTAPQTFSMPEIQAPTDFEGQKKFDDSFVVTKGSKTLDDVKKEIEEDEKLKKVQAMFFNPDDLDLDDDDNDVDDDDGHMVSLSATGGMILNDVSNMPLQNAEVPDDNLPALDNKPLVSFTGVDSPKEVVTEPQKIVSLDGLSASDAGTTELSGGHKGFLEMFGNNSNLSKLMGSNNEEAQEDLSVGTSMSVEEAKNLINLSEIPQQAGSDGFVVPTDLLSVPQEPSNVNLSDGGSLITERLG